MAPKKSKKNKKNTLKKVDTESKTTPIVSDGKLDPRELDAWSGDMSNLKKTFEFAMPLRARIALSDPNGASLLPPSQQSFYSMFHLVHLISQSPPCFRFIYQYSVGVRTPDYKRQDVIIDVLAPIARNPVALACPDTVPHFEEDRFKELGGSPLIPVRFLYIRNEVSALISTALESTVEDVKGRTTPGINVVHAESAAEVISTVRMLEENAKQYSTEYLQYFDSLSPYHREDLFNVSFLVPPESFDANESVLSKVEDVSSCFNCHVSGVPLKVCSRCHDAKYCGPACQKAHWKAGHKLQCGGSRKGGKGVKKGSADRPSVVLPMEGAKAMAGMFSSTISLQSGGTRQGKAFKVGEVPGTNMHGDKEFVVKIQVLQLLFHVAC